jgi:hypothetical protein
MSISIGAVVILMLSLFILFFIFIVPVTVMEIEYGKDNHKRFIPHYIVSIIHLLV